MNSISLRAFADELEKIAIDANQLIRIMGKESRKGWNAARVDKSIDRLLRRESRRLSKNVDPHRLDRSAFESTRITSSPTSATSAFEPTVSARRPAAAVAPTPTPAPAPASAPIEKKPSMLRRAAAVGGIGGLGIVGGHMLPHREERAY